MLFITVASLLAIGCHFPLSDFDLKEFKELHAELLPIDETWTQIDWHIDLLSAQKQAASQNKPLFIWAMDGHPLGCT